MQSDIHTAPFLEEDDLGRTYRQRADTVPAYGRCHEIGEAGLCRGSDR